VRVSGDATEAYRESQESSTDSVQEEATEAYRESQESSTDSVQEEATEAYRESQESSTDSVQEEATADSPPRAPGAERQDLERGSESSPSGEDRDSSGGASPTESDGRSGGGAGITEAQQQNIDAALAEESARVRSEQQGIEARDDRVGEVAREQEQRLIEEYPSLNEDDVRVERRDDQIVATVTPTGAEELGANPTDAEVADRVRDQVVRQDASVDEDDIKVQVTDGEAQVRYTDEGAAEEVAARGFEQSLPRARAERLAADLAGGVAAVAGGFRESGEEAAAAVGEVFDENPLDLTDTDTGSGPTLGSAPPQRDGAEAELSSREERLQDALISTEEATAESPPTAPGAEQQNLERVVRATEESSADPQDGAEPDPNQGDATITAADIGRAARPGGQPLVEAEDFASAGGDLAETAEATGQGVRETGEAALSESEQRLSEAVGRDSPASERARDAAATGLDLVFQDPDEALAVAEDLTGVDTDLDIQERTGGVAISGPGVVANVSEGQLFESGDSGRLNRRITDSLTAGKGLFATGTRQLDRPGALNTPDEVGAGTDAADLEQAILERNPTLDEDDISVSQGELGEFTISTNLDETDVRERIAAENPGVSPDDVEFRRRDGEVVPVTGRGGSFFSPTEYGLQQGAQGRQERFGVEDEVENAVPDTEVAGVDVNSLAGGLGRLPGSVAAAPETILLTADTATEVSANAPRTVSEYGAAETAQTGVETGGRAADQLISEAERDPEGFVGELAGGLLVGTAALRGIEGGAARVRNLRRRTQYDAVVDYRDVTTERGVQGLAPEFDTPTDAPVREAVEETRRLAGDLPDKFDRLDRLSLPEAAAIRAGQRVSGAIPDTPNLNIAQQAGRIIGRGQNQLSTVIPDTPNLNIARRPAEIVGGGRNRLSPSRFSGGRAASSTDAPGNDGVDIPDSDGSAGRPGPRDRLPNPGQAAEDAGFDAGVAVGQRVGRARDAVNRAGDRAEAAGFAAGRPVGAAVGVIGRPFGATLDGAERAGRVVGRRTGNAVARGRETASGLEQQTVGRVASPFETRAQAVGRRAGEFVAGVEDDVTDVDRVPDSLLFRSDSEPLPEGEFAAEAGEFELAGLFTSPRLSPLRLEMGNEGRSLGLRLLPDVTDSGDQVTVFPGDRVEGMPPRAAGSGITTDASGERVPDPDAAGTQYLREEADTGTAYVRPSGDRTRELEAVFPEGSEFRELNSQFGVRLPGGRIVEGRTFTRGDNDAPTSTSPDGESTGVDADTVDTDSVPVTRISSGTDSSPVSPPLSTAGAAGSGTSGARNGGQRSSPGRIPRDRRGGTGGGTGSGGGSSEGGDGGSTRPPTGGDRTPAYTPPTGPPSSPPSTPPSSPPGLPDTPPGTSDTPPGTPDTPSETPEIPPGPPDIPPPERRPRPRPRGDDEDEDEFVPEGAFAGTRTDDFTDFIDPLTGEVLETEPGPRF